MALVSEARFKKLQTLGRKNGLPPFTLAQVNHWKAERERKIREGGPFTVLVTGTDGCAAHIMLAVMPLLQEMSAGKITFVKELMGWEAMREAGLTDPRQDLRARFPEKTWRAAMESDAVLFGAVGSEWDDPKKHPEISSQDRPQWALMQLRFGFDLFANVRTSRFFPSLGHLSPLKPELIEGIDQITVVRELTRGLYSGEPRGWVQPNGWRNLWGLLGLLVDKAKIAKEAVDAARYSEAEIERVVRVAFELAKAQRARLISLDKANVLFTSRLWRRVIERIAKEYSEVAANSTDGETIDSWYVDDGLQRLVGKPSQFVEQGSRKGVIVTANLFGDIAGDVLGTVTVGSIGMIPSGGYGDGSWPYYFEPVHGSAPRRFPASGRLEDSVVNPLATVLSAEMMLRSLGLDSLATALMRAVEDTLNQGYRTYDIFRSQPGERRVGTLDMVNAVGENVNRILGTGRV